MKPILKHQALSYPALILLGFILLLLRAWPRLLYPEVWIEDGTQNLAGFINEGWINFASPVGGYLVFIPKLITFLALQISFTTYPLISTLLAWIFILFVFLVIAKAPTYLQGAPWLAISCFLIPSDAECFGLPMYTYWWSALLLFILIFWKENQNTIFRAFLLVIASLSSPVCLVTLPLLWLRALMYKRSNVEKLLALIASVLCLTQLFVMALHSNPSNIHLSSLDQWVPVFLGSYLVGNLAGNLRWVAGIALLALLCLGIYRNKNWVLGGLIYLWCTSVLMSMYRVDVSILDPIHAGPRYFFFPYILLSWILIELAYSSVLIVKIASISVLALSIANAVPHLDRRHDRLQWQEHVWQCAQSQTYTFPVHFAGGANNVWFFTLTGKQCARLLERDPFWSHSQ